MKMYVKLLSRMFSFRKAMVLYVDGSLDFLLKSSKIHFLNLLNKSPNPSWSLDTSKWAIQPYMGCTGTAQRLALLLVECLLCSCWLCASWQQFCGLTLKCHNQDTLSGALVASVRLQAVTECFLVQPGRSTGQSRGSFHHPLLHVLLHALSARETLAKV